jgi:hypothetical protein
MAELSVGEDLTGVKGFPMEEQLRHHEDLVARYGSAKRSLFGFERIKMPKRGMNWAFLKN